MSPESTPQRIFNRHNQGARILNGEKYVEEGAWWDYQGIRDDWQMESKPVQETITSGKNDIKLQAEAR